MGFRERNRYIQLCRENEHSAFYYDTAEEKLLRYKKESKFSFSLKYQLSILVTLYLGYLLNAKLYTVLVQNIFLKHLIIFLCLVIGCVGLLFFENDIAKKIENDGRKVPYILSDELLLKGQKDLKTQKMIIYLWTLISAIILLLFYRTNFVLILAIFLASVIALSAMAAATRPVLRAKTYKKLENGKNNRKLIKEREQ